jgi:hypothetical protein
VEEPRYCYRIEVRKYEGKKISLEKGRIDGRIMLK